MIIERNKLKMSQKNHTEDIKATKFNFINKVPYVHYFYEWITGGMYFSGSSANYWSWISCNVYNKSENALRITVKTSSTIYVTGFKINILLVSRETTPIKIFVHEMRTKSGKFLKNNFVNNFGIDNNVYG